MRSIPTEAVTQLSQQYGVEGINIVRVWWSDTNYTDYADKTNQEELVQGRIISLSGLEDVQDLDGRTNSSSISVVLDDADGELKNIIDNFDIHKIKAQVLQWFKGIPKSSAFVLFDGQINTPIVWDEGKRTLSFNIISVLENREFGFSAEEGAFAFLPDSVAGQPWPVVFGTVIKVPALQIMEAPSIITAEGFGVIYEDVWNREIAELDTSADEASVNFFSSFVLGFSNESISAGYRDGFGPPVTPIDDPELAEQYHEAGQQYFQQAAQYRAEQFNILNKIAALQEDFADKNAYAKSVVRIVSPDVPRNVTYQVEIGSKRFNASFSGATMILGDEIDLPEESNITYFSNFEIRDVSTLYENKKNTEKFHWIDAGTRVRLLNFPVRYVATFGTSQVHNIYGKQQGVYVKVPTSDYTVSYNTFTSPTTGNVLTATIITFLKPLSSYKDPDGNQIWDSDEIYCDVQGEVNGTFVDIVSWTVQNFTDLVAPPGSNWDDVKALTLNVPMNFVVTERKNALDFIKELAFQAKCAAWVNDGFLWLRYLPEKPTPVDSITTADILEDTLEIFCSDTEELVTKFVAEWKFELEQSRPNRTIYRYNVERYGTHEEKYNYFAFQHVEQVKWSARYWIIRKANTWKKIRFRTLIHKLKLETFDPITVDLVGLVSNDPVVGIIESAVYDSASNEIDMTVWLPIRWGEMDEYTWAYPKDVVDLYPKADDPRFRTGNPFEGAEDDDNVFDYRAPFLSVVKGSLGPHFPVRADAYTPQLADNKTVVDTALTDVTVNFNKPPGLNEVNNKNRFVISAPKTFTVDSTITTEMFLGTVVEHLGGDIYSVNLLGFANPVEVQQRQIADDEIIPNTTPVLVLKQSGLYYMQAPVWLQEPEDEEE